ncbi:MAG: TonB-dependent receptor [Thermodesulfobacteriota bacterium]|nr:TonB-dependent receptor [Thermodesulfobacteriota bacterium]
MNVKMNKLLMLFVLMFTFSPFSVWAEQDQEKRNDETSGVFDLGEVVVTGKRETITTVSTVDTIDRDRVKMTNTNNVSDALTTVPGTYLNVGTKNERNIIVRGLSQKYVPVFFDGIPIYLPYDGFVDTGNLTTNNISKITLTKGISSVLYGFNTMAGVINVVTMKPEKQFEGDYRLEISENNTFDVGINVGSRLDRFYFMLNGNRFYSDGFSLSDGFDPTDNEDGGLRDNSDIDDWNGSAKIGFMPADGHEYAFGVQLVEREKGLPPSTTGRARYWRFTDWEKKTYYFIGDTPIADHFLVKTRVYRDEYYNVLDSYDDDFYSDQTRGYAFHSTYDDYSNGGSIILRSDIIPRNTISFSFHCKEDVHREQDDRDEAWEKYEQKMISYGLEDDIKVTEKVALVIGASYDIQKAEYANGGPLRDDEKAFNPQAGVRVTVLKDADLHFSVGRKTRFPTLFEYYSGQFGRMEPNPNLEEEEAMNYEAGIKKPIAGESVIGLTAFYSDIENLIVQKEIAEDTDQYQNIGEARFQGLEFSFQSSFFENNDFEIHYTYLDAEDRSPYRTSDNLEESSEHKIYISDLFKLNHWISFFGKAEYNSKRYYEDFDSGEWRTLDGFWVVDAKVILTVSKNLEVELGARNLLDDNYELSDGYPREGRNLFFAVKGTF